MENSAAIIVRRMIVHKVDHKNYDAPLLSDLESPFTGEVERFVTRHIASNRQHKRARTARFTEAPTRQGTACALCYQILADPGSFVGLSRRLATRLFNSMAGDMRISPGDLVVCTFTDEDEAESEWLALLKMDPQDGFVGERQEVGGQVRVVLRRVREVLPAGELQKCCFVLPAHLRQARGYDLIVLDQQAARYWMRRLVASFFLEDFLRCEVGFESTEKTRTFIYQSHNWVSQREGVWPDQDVAYFKRRIIESAQARQVDAAALAQETIADAAEQDEYLEYLRGSGLDELTFEPDPAETQSWAQFAWYKGDDDLQVRIRRDAVGEGRTLDKTFDEATNTHVVTIRTTNWIPTLRRGG